MEVLYERPLIGMTITGMTVVCLLALGLLVVSGIKSRLAMERAKEFNRFIAYVCKANDLVMEVDMEQNKKYYYSVKDGEVVSEEEPLQSFEEMFSLLHPEDYELISGIVTRDHILQIIEEEEVINFECRVLTNETSYQWFSFSLQGMGTDDRNHKRIMVISYNIDELKRSEEEKRQALLDALEMAKQAGSAKGDFMSSISHEIRTPLNAVIGYMSIAEEEKEDQEKVAAYISKAKLAARHLLGIINDVLDISSIESGKMKIARDDFDFKQLLNTITAMFYTQAKEKSIRFHVALNEVTEEWLVGDPLRLNQVLMNLLSNAVKFTPAGGRVDLEITQNKIENEKVYLSIRVADSGIGMSEEFMSRLFMPFEQQDSSVARKYGGTGLGLSITKNLVTMMQGTIGVSSKEGEGTIFRVDLTLGQSERNAKLQNVYNLSKLRVLVVDDDESVCEYMQMMLKKCGVKCDVAHTGAEGLKKMVKKSTTSHPYDMCLLDYSIPDMDGIETAEKIREECGSDVPIIMATAYDTSVIKDSAEKTGVNKIISKPVFQSTMFDILVNAYGQYEQPGKKKPEMQDMQGIHILLAEDNEMNMEIALSILGKAGMIVEGVENGRKALDRFQYSKPGAFDAVLMDVQMPVMNGYEAARLIRSCGHVQAKTIPIIAMTANAFAEDINEALAAGMNDHVAKPVNYQKLYGALKKYMTENSEESNE